MDEAKTPGDLLGGTRVTFFPTSLSDARGPGLIRRSSGAIDGLDIHFSR